MSQARLSACMLIPHKGHADTIQVYSVTVMTHVKALQAGHSSQGTSEPITPALLSGRQRQAINADPTMCVEFILDRGVPGSMSAQHFAAPAENIQAPASCMMSACLLWQVRVCITDESH